MPAHLEPPFPAAFPSEAITVFIDKARGRGDHDVACLAQAGWIVAGYAAAQAVGEPHLVGGTGAELTPEMAADTLELALKLRTADPGNPMAGVDWRSLAIIVLEVLRQWLLQPKP